MSNFVTMKTDMNLLGMANLIGQDMGALLNKCQREEVESYPWSFLYQTVTIYGSKPFQDGTATITNGSVLVSGSTLSWPVTKVISLSAAGAVSVLPDNAFYLWLGPTLTTPMPLAGIYSGAGVPGDISNKAFLTVPSGMPTLTSDYTLQQVFYPIAPLETVYRVRQIDDLIETSQAELNAIDPSRIATGGSPSLRWAQGPFATNITALTFTTRIRPEISGFVGTAIDTDTPMIELWPRSTQALPYIVEGKIGAVDMVADADLPMIPSQVLEAKAMMYACRAIFASSGNPKWLSLAQEYNKDYMVELEKAKTEDSKRIIPKGITSWGGRRLFDASVDYNHDLAGPPGGFSEWT